MSAAGGNWHSKFFAGHETKILVNFFAIWGVLYLPISQQPVELQNTATPKFGVAHGALSNGKVNVDLKSSKAGQQADHHISAASKATEH